METVASDIGAIDSASGNHPTDVFYQTTDALFQAPLEERHDKLKRSLTCFHDTSAESDLVESHAKRSKRCTSRAVSPQCLSAPVHTAATTMSSASIKNVEIGSISTSLHGTVEEGEKPREESTRNALQINEQRAVTVNTCDFSATLKEELHSGSAGMVCAAASLGTNIQDTCQLAKQGQHLCHVRFELERGGRQLLPPHIIDVTARTTMDTLQDRVERRPDSFSVWKLFPVSDSAEHVSPYTSLCDYFETRRRIGLLETPRTTVFIVPLKNASTALDLVVSEVTLFAFVFHRRVAKAKLGAGDATSTQVLSVAAATC